MAERLKRNIRRAGPAVILTAGLGLGGAGTAIASQLPESSAHTAYVQTITDTSKGMDITGNGVVRLGKTDTGLRGSDNKKAFVVKTAQPGDSLRSIVTDNLQENRGQKVTRAHIDREVAITAVASGITNVNADLRKGQQVAVPDKEYTSTLIHAGNNRGDAELKKDVLAMNAEIRKEGIGPALDEAQKVVDKMGVKQQELKSGEAGTSTRANETNRRLGITDQDAKTNISSAEMYRRIDNVKKSGRIDTSALHDDHIWDQQKYENRTAQSDAETNMTSRMAVQLTKFDSKLNPNGNFDEYRMREGAKFNEFTEQMDTLMGVVGSMNTKELISIKQDLPHDVWVKLIKIWEVNQGTAVNDDIRNRDVAAASVYLEIAERIDLKNAPKEVVAFINKLQNTSDRQEKIALLLKSPDMVKKLFMTTTPITPGNPDGGRDNPEGKPLKTEKLGPWSTEGHTDNPPGTRAHTPGVTEQNKVPPLEPTDWGLILKNVGIGAGVLGLLALGALALKRKEIQEKMSPAKKKYVQEKLQESLNSREAEKKDLTSAEILAEKNRIRKGAMTVKEENKVRLNMNKGIVLIPDNETSVGMNEGSVKSLLRECGEDLGNITCKDAFEEYEAYKSDGKDGKYAFVVNARKRRATTWDDISRSRKDRKLDKNKLKLLQYISYEPRLVNAVEPISPPPPTGAPTSEPHLPDPGTGVADPNKKTGVQPGVTASKIPPPVLANKNIIKSSTGAGQTAPTGQEAHGTFSAFKSRAGETAKTANNKAKSAVTKGKDAVKGAVAGVGGMLQSRVDLAKEKLNEKKKQASNAGNPPAGQTPADAEQSSTGVKKLFEQVKGKASEVRTKAKDSVAKRKPKEKPAEDTQSKPEEKKRWRDKIADRLRKSRESIDRLNAKGEGRSADYFEPNTGDIIDPPVKPEEPAQTKDIITGEIVSSPGKGQSMESLESSVEDENTFTEIRLFGESTKVEKGEDRSVIIKNFSLKPASSYFAVFDGHGGDLVSNYLRENHNKKLLELLQKDVPVEEALKKSFLDINEDIKNRMDTDAGSTAVVGLLVENTLYVANAGDSHAVLSKNNKSIRLTVEHNLQNPDELDRVRSVVEADCFEGNIVNSVGNGVQNISRSIGDKDFLGVIAEPFTMPYELTTECEKIIVASDGLWRVLPDQEALNLIRDIKDPKEAAEILIKVAKDKEMDSKDDISVIVVNLS